MQLSVKLLREAPKTKPANPQVYSLYLQARQLSNQLSVERYRVAEVMFKQALTIEPAYAAAWTGLSENYFRLVGAESLAADVGYGLARDAADRALANDPDDAPACAQAGWQSICPQNDLGR